MTTILHALRQYAGRLVLLFLLAALLIALPGCATSDADLNYTRDTSAGAPGDHSYHGWNESNY